MDFLFGLILGIALLRLYDTSYSHYKTHKLYIAPLDEYINKKIADFSFVERVNSLVKIKYTDNTLLLISLDTAEISILTDGELSVYTMDENKKKIDYLLSRLLVGFYDEVYVNVIELNNHTISTNLLDNNVDITEDSIPPINIPSVDEILDKINEHGIDSLTETELSILREVT